VSDYTTIYGNDRTVSRTSYGRLQSAN